MKALLFATLLLAVGCDGGTPSEDAGLDSGLVDAAGPADAAAADASTVDAGTVDAGTVDGGGSGGSASCDLQTAAGYCQEYGEFAAGSLSAYRDACGTSGGTWADAACPAASRLGGCATTSALGTITNWFYEGGPYADADAVRMVCSAGMGEFVAP